MSDSRLQHPLIRQLQTLEATTWFNLHLAPVEQGLAQVGLTRWDVQEAEARLQRFAPFLARAFPETAAANGIIESPVVAIPAMQQWLAKTEKRRIAGALWLKKDSHLPISGSVKAGGGRVPEEAMQAYLAEGQRLLQGN